MRSSKFVERPFRPPPTPPFHLTNVSTAGGNLTSIARNSPDRTRYLDRDCFFSAAVDDPEFDHYMECVALMDAARGPTVGTLRSWGRAREALVASRGDGKRPLDQANKLPGCKGGSLTRCVSCLHLDPCLDGPLPSFVVY